jgi:hypothetical protein
VRSSGEGMGPSKKRFTGVCRNGELVRIKGTLRCEHLERYELMTATGEDSHNCEGRFTTVL